MLARRRRRAAGDAGAHRSACCLRPMRQAARATSDTRTSESRDAPGSATRRRRRNLRTTALAEKEYASFSLAFDRNQRSIGTHFVATSAPAHRPNEEACDVDREREHIARGTQPPPARVYTQRMIYLKLQDEATGNRHADNDNAKHGEAHDRCTQQRKRQRMCDYRASVAHWTHRAHGPRPAKLVLQKFFCTAL